MDENEGGVSRDACVARVLEHAPQQPTADTVAFARLVAAKLASGELWHLGLTHDALNGLAVRHFPGALRDVEWREPIADALLKPFVDELRALLLRFESLPGEAVDDARCLAAIIAAACLRPDHLWRDLGLDGRADVTELLTRHYPDLVARNVENLRWKK